MNYISLKRYPQLKYKEEKTIANWINRQRSLIKKDKLSIIAFVVCVENIVHAMIYDSLFSRTLLLFSAIILSRRDHYERVNKERNV